MKAQFVHVEGCTDNNSLTTSRQYFNQFAAMSFQYLGHSFSSDLGFNIDTANYSHPPLQPATIEVIRKLLLNGRPIEPQNMLMALTLVHNDNGLARAQFMQAKLEATTDVEELRAIEKEMYVLAVATEKVSQPWYISLREGDNAYRNFVVTEQRIVEGGEMITARDSDLNAKFCRLFSSTGHGTPTKRNELGNRGRGTSNQSKYHSLYLCPIQNRYQRWSLSGINGKTES